MSSGTGGPTPSSFITTAIPYVNAQPHIGFALELVLADAQARHRRGCGEDVRFQTGSDENSLKNVQAAASEGVPTEALVERNAEKFRGLIAALDLSCDDFIRTSTEPRHIEGVRKLWERCAQSGDIYRKPYEGLYCVGCEQFYAESDLPDGVCPEHLTKPERVVEENYFFRLSRYSERLLRLIESGALRIEPGVRKNEILSLIRMGLEDFSISRSTTRAHGWGIEVPGDPEQVMYVWFDALGNYISALGYAEEGPLYQRYWVSSAERIHVIGKGITRFHAVYWPAILLSAGAPLPSSILVHGYVTVEGQKISKTLGNVIDPYSLVERFGVDPVRYFLLRHLRSTEDGDFSLARLTSAYNSDLADRLGNLLNRTVSMIDRYFEGAVPPRAADAGLGGLEAVATEVTREIRDAMRAFRSHDALAQLFRLVDAANKHVEDSAPWTLAKARKTDPGAEGRLGTVLHDLAEALRVVALELAAFLPGTSRRILERLGLDPDASMRSTWGSHPLDTRVRPGGVIFPKIDDA